MKLNPFQTNPKPFHPRNLPGLLWHLDMSRARHNVKLDAGKTVDSLVTKVREAGGEVIINHPGRKGKPNP